MNQAPLTAEQRRIIDSPHGPGMVTVQAVAGSGKTYMLVERARALGGRGVSLNRILFLSFTSAAKDTLRERLKVARLDKCTVRTIHGLLSVVLPRDRFTYDHRQMEGLIAETYRTAPCDSPNLEKFRSALRSAWMQCQLTGTGTMSEHPVLGDALCTFAALRAAYEEDSSRTLMGHDDLLIWGHRALEAGDPAMNPLLTSYEVVIADEFQDVSPLQSAIVEAVARGKHLMVVADPAQSIFGFQGSTGKSFLQLAQQSAPMPLSDNFRCPGAHLLAASFQLRGTQRLVPARGFNGDLQVEWCGTHSDILERLGVRIAALSQAGEEINILVRWTAEAREIVTFLQRRGYRVSSPKQATEELFRDPACRDVLRPVLEVLKRRWAAKHPLRTTLMFLGLPLTQQERQRLDGSWSSRRTPGEARPSTDDLSPGMELALRLWTDLHEFTGDSSALLSLLQPYLAELSAEQARLLSRVLDRRMSLLDLETALQTAEQPAAREIHVRTIHSAKGKEFPCVVLAEFPRTTGNTTGTDDDWEIGDWEMPDKPVRRISAGSHLETGPAVTCTEEDRICYVALTRSTRLLYALLPATSNFARALAPEHLEYIARVQNLLARPHHQWSPVDEATWPRLAHDPALDGYLERYWWRHTDPVTLARAKKVLVDARLPVPASWTSDDTSGGEHLEATFRIRRIPFRRPKV